MGFPSVLANARKGTGMSQSQLAERAGYDHSYVSRLESGQRKPKPDAIRRLIKAMNYEQDSPVALSLMNAAGYLISEHAIIPKWSSVVKLNEFLDDDATPDWLCLYVNELVGYLLGLAVAAYAEGGQCAVSQRPDHLRE